METSSWTGTPSTATSSSGPASRVGEGHPAPPRGTLGTAASPPTSPPRRPRVQAGAGGGEAAVRAEPGRGAVPQHGPLRHQPLPWCAPGCAVGACTPLCVSLHPKMPPPPAPCILASSQPGIPIPCIPPSPYPTAQHPSTWHPSVPAAPHPSFLVLCIPVTLYPGSLHPSITMYCSLPPSVPIS